MFEMLQTHILKLLLCLQNFAIFASLCIASLVVGENHRIHQTKDAEDIFPYNHNKQHRNSQRFSLLVLAKLGSSQWYQYIHRVTVFAGMSVYEVYLASSQNKSNFLKPFQKLSWQANTLAFFLECNLETWREIVCFSGTVGNLYLAFIITDPFQSTCSLDGLFSFAETGSCAIQVRIIKCKLNNGQMSNFLTIVISTDFLIKSINFNQNDNVLQNVMIYM